MKLLAGRNFSKVFPRDDSLAVIVNEAMVKHMNWESNEQAIGKQLFTPSGHERVIGVVKDFNYEPLHNKLGPFVLDMPAPKHKVYWTRYIGVKIKPGQVAETITNVESIWNKYSQEFPYEYFLLEDDLNKQYKKQEDLAKLVGGFSVIAIIVACMGLFALALFTAEQRTKEIGIRKVMGASVSQIVFILSADFLKLVLIANLIAWPLSWYLVQEWLKGFAYRVGFNWPLLACAALFTLFIALATIVFQAIKAALSDPVKSLRYE
ncbi:MAG: FtsX-like permease family protein, partial [Bacteroidota bacterium]